MCAIVISEYRLYIIVIEVIIQTVIVHNIKGINKSWYLKYTK